MGGTIEGKFRLLHTVKDHKKLGAVAGRLGIEKVEKKDRLKGATRKTYIVEEIRGAKPTKKRREEP
jgi:hypothetical protein